MYKFWMHTEALKKAIELSGGQVSLAGKIGRTQQHISWCLCGLGRISAEDAIRIERAVDGKVSRRDLRPDIFDPPETAAEAHETIPANRPQYKAVSR